MEKNEFLTLCSNTSAFSNASSAHSTAMLGAACGDITGSLYERFNIKYKLKESEMVEDFLRFTDDTVMTCAVAHGLKNGLGKLPRNWIECIESEKVLCDNVCASLVEFGRKYPHAGYGGKFVQWIYDDVHEPYNSWGNGSAMRASYAGWVANSLQEAEKLGEISAKVTHSHPYGIKGAQVVAGCIYLLRAGGTKADIQEYAGKFYDLNFNIDDIREDYTFDVSCEGSVPQAIKAFLEGENFADVLATAISVGGDSDTIAAIAGSIAEVIYPISNELKGLIYDKLDLFLQETIVEAVGFVRERA